MMTVALNDPFNLEDFDERRQGIINALVADTLAIWRTSTLPVNSRYSSERSFSPLYPWVAVNSRGCLFRLPLRAERSISPRKLYLPRSIGSTSPKLICQIRSRQPSTESEACC